MKMSPILWPSVAAAALLSCASSETAPPPQQAPAVQTLTVETRIVGDAQAGMKSRQTITVDFERGLVTSDFVTGVTNIGIATLNSIRDDFTVQTVAIDGQRAEVRISGETASGVGFMPSIDYSFTIVLRRDGTGRISGCHDGYPGYEVRRGNRAVYAYAHEPNRVDLLVGDCDIRVASRSF